MKTVTVRIEDQLKAQAEDVLARHGVSPTEAVNHLYLYVAQHGRLPFRVRPVSESPEDVFSTLLKGLRTVKRLIDAVAGLPNDDPRRSPLSTRCLLSCQILRRDIAENIAFVSAVSCRAPLPREGTEDAGNYWRNAEVQLNFAVSALEERAPDMSETLTGIARQLTELYWELATWIDLYAFQESDDSRMPQNPDRRDTRE